MRQLERIANGIIDHRRLTLVVVFLIIAAVSGGVVFLQQESAMPAFTIGSEEEAAQEYIESNFSTEQSNVTVTQIVVEDENVLDKETLVSTLELQETIRANETVAGTLVDERPTVSIANFVARAAVVQQHPETSTPTLAEQRATLAAMDTQEIEAIIEQLLGDGEQANQDAFALMPSDYERGSPNATATMIAVFQTDEINAAGGQAPDHIVESQTAIQSLATDHSDAETLVIGNGILTGEMDQANQETFTLLGPLAMLFVLVTLSLAYRDLFDILLSFLGIVLVLLWTFGALGWLGISFNPTLIAIPVLLIGLSIDFGIHVFMRYREAKRSAESIPASMKAGLAGVGVALTWVTVTTVIGFLSNLASPVPLIREIGLIAAIGILGALVVFTGFVPPLKTVLDEFLERHGFDRHQTPIGTDGGRTTRLLSVGSTVARKAPLAVLVAVLLLTAGTTVAATQVSTTFDNEDTLVEDAPAWTEPLPEPFATSEYTAKENYQAVDERFIHPDSQVQFLVEGTLTDPQLLDRIAEAEQAAANQSTVSVLANGKARTTSPLSVIDSVAARNESFNQTVVAADTTGDGIPDRNIEQVYDELYEVAPEDAASVIHRQNGEYESLRLSIAVDRTARGEQIDAQSRTLAERIDGENQNVTATGQPIVTQIVQDSLLESLLVTLFLTLVVITGLLALVYRVAYDSATLGIITLLPVVMTVSWVFATMYALGFALNLVTTIVASLAIGLGADYSIHVSERFRSELASGRTVEGAIRTTIAGTGGALLGSATTTALGFGVLAFALVPILQQFGAIMAIMILYAFVAAVFVLPSLLVLWARYFASPEQSTSSETVQQDTSLAP